MTSEGGKEEADAPYKGLFYDDSSVASSPGKMRVNILQWIGTNFSSVAKKIAFLVVAVALMIKVHWLFATLVLGAVLYNIWYWATVYNKFRAGDVNPGKVVSVNPDLVAVSTNMSRGIGNFPALKIISTKLARKDKVLGKIIPTVALYNDNPYDYPFWAEFHPVPVAYGVRDPQQLDYLTSQFSDGQIQEIDRHLEQVPTVKPGIYKIDVENSHWHRFPHVDLNKGVQMEKPPQAGKLTARHHCLPTGLP